MATVKESTDEPKIVAMALLRLDGTGNRIRGRRDRAVRQRG